MILNNTEENKEDIDILVYKIIPQKNKRRML